MNICILSYSFPGRHNSSDFAFVKQLVDEFAAQGNNCQVIAPFNITHYRRLSVRRERYSYGMGMVTVYRPGYLSFSGFRIGKFNPTSLLRKRAIKIAFRMLEEEPDVIYGHFWRSAYDAYEYAKKKSVPLFVATGESDIRRLFTIPQDHKSFREYVSGVICVSTKNRDESIALGLTTLEKCKVFPNAVNTALFRKMEKLCCRQKLGLPEEGFIIAFVGWFNERKGPRRLAKAIDEIKEKNVMSVFIGKGEQEPYCNNILFKGSLPHDKLPFYLSASDIFVLPTLNEGCCNAVIEAMACGLPIVSSDRPFNWDVLNKNNSIMVDPMDITAIKDAIVLLRDNTALRELLSGGALTTAQSLTINERAKGIIDFMKSKLNTAK